MAGGDALPTWFFIILREPQAHERLLNYFGQCALLPDSLQPASNPFYQMAPRVLLYPMVALARRFEYAKGPIKVLLNDLETYKEEKADQPGRIGAGFLPLAGFLWIHGDPQRAGSFRGRTGGFDIDIRATSFYMGRETLITSGDTKMAAWRKSLFTFLSRNAWNVSTYLGIPPDRVVELGSQVEI